MNDQQIKLFGSRGSDDWATPKWLYDLLDAAFSFNLDPCPLEPKEDGLGLEWNGSVFVNPPYSNVQGFFEKAEQEWESGRAHIIVFLVFANTDTQWFHRYVYGKYKVVPIEGRLKFGDGKQVAMRPSILCIRKRV